MAMFVLGTTGCGGTTTGGGADVTPDASAPTGTVVSAADGGTVTSPDGVLTLKFPPGALAEDTPISITIEAGDDGTVYRFAPDGLAFLQPVELSATIPHAPDESTDLSFAGFPIFLTSDDGVTSEGLDATFEFDAAAGQLLLSSNIEHFSAIVLVHEPTQHFWSGEATFPGQKEVGGLVPITVTLHWEDFHMPSHFTIESVELVTLETHCSGALSQVTEAEWLAHRALPEGATIVSHQPQCLCEKEGEGTISMEAVIGLQAAVFTPRGEKVAKTALARLSHSPPGAVLCGAGPTEGSCTQPDGSCNDGISESECEEVGGIFEDYGTCLQDFEVACCLPSGKCVDGLLDEECIGEQMPEKSCADDPCPCEPDCLHKECNSADGCGGTCKCKACCDDHWMCLDVTIPTCNYMPGLVQEEDACGPDSCCPPNCYEKECGDDGCGSPCPPGCDAGYECAQGKCVCKADCSDKECGYDGCGGVCAECEWGQICVDHSCEDLECEPECQDLQCGDDGCGGVCECDPGMIYLEDVWEEEECVPDCADVECGEEDGCGGVCECPVGGCCLLETAGGCLDQTHANCTDMGGDFLGADLCSSFDKEQKCCDIWCEDRECGPDPCGGSCGECPDEMPYCNDGQCGIECDPQCYSKDCGDDDGCGAPCPCNPCCFNEDAVGACEDFTEPYCTQQGGFWLPGGTCDDDPNPCCEAACLAEECGAPNPCGGEGICECQSCCVAGGKCELKTPMVCTLIGGTPMGLADCPADDATCDGIDDDCDGDIDEDYAGAATECGVGACAASGTMVCTDGQQSDTCAPSEPADDDATCDGIDDDCDGSLDEDYEGGETNCGEGCCANTGTSTCVDGEEVSDCQPLPGKFSDPYCNGLDDDCDGEIDEDVLFIGDPCDAQTAWDELYNGGVDKDLAEEGVRACPVDVHGCGQGGATYCEEKPVVDTVDVCDGQDNDNNGYVDDVSFWLAPAGDNSCGGSCALAGVAGDPCNTDEDACTGVWMCANPSEPPPDPIGPEKFNSLWCSDENNLTVKETDAGDGACFDQCDNDCDGLTDADDPDCQ